MPNFNRTVFARGHRRAGREPGTMNRNEQAYEDELKRRQSAGEIIEYKFECLKLRLAPKLFYDTDFMVLLADGSLEIHEVKPGKKDKDGGVTFFSEDPSWIKLKMAAALFPFLFRVVYRSPRHMGGAWHNEVMPSA